MSLKYDTEIKQLNLNSSHGQILSQIKANSTVLECGCATGYMTKYMKEKLGCSVYIVEYDEDAYLIAKQYAAGGIHADLMSDTWAEYFKDIAFDYIIFADVLEHITDPLKVLKTAVTMLKDDGAVFVSLPNVTHNDVVISMLNNTWNYTELGLLDNTHVHFWGHDNLEPFFMDAGLCIVKEGYSIVPTGLSEQAVNSIDHHLRAFLNSREWGMVYQFIIKAQKQHYVEHNNISIEKEVPKASMAMASLYHSHEETFLHGGKISCYFNTPMYRQRFLLGGKDTAYLRFDPVEYGTCIVEHIEVRTDAGEFLKIEPINGIRVDIYDVFGSLDPQYRIYTEGKTIYWLDIQAIISPLEDQSIISVLAKLISNEKYSRETMRMQSQAIAAKDAWIEQQSEMLAYLQKEKEQKEAYLEELQTCLDQKDKAIAAKDAWIEQQSEMLAYVQKEKEQKEAYIDEINTANQELILSLRKKIAKIENTWIWRNTKAFHKDI